MIMRSRYVTAFHLAFALAIFVGCVDSPAPEEDDPAGDEAATGGAPALVCPIPVKGEPPSGYTQCMSCGNGYCEPGLGETSSNCPSDCGPYYYCGDGLCTSGEYAGNCMTDCHCGNGVCDAGWGETSSTCPGDCSTGGGGGGCYIYPCP
jgi:hypothetical protein